MGLVINKATLTFPEFTNKIVWIGGYITEDNQKIVVIFTEQPKSNPSKPWDVWDTTHIAATMNLEQFVKFFPQMQLRKDICKYPYICYFETAELTAPWINDEIIIPKFNADRF